MSQRNLKVLMGMRHCEAGDDGQSIKIYCPAGDWGVELVEGKNYLVTLSECSFVELNRRRNCTEIIIQKSVFGCVCQVVFNDRFGFGTASR